MKAIVYFLLLVCGLVLSSCSAKMITTTYDEQGRIMSKTEQPGSIFGPSSYDVGYRQMNADFEQEKTARVKALSDSTKCPEEDKVAQAWCLAMGKMAGLVASLDKPTFKAPTTGFDVIDHNFGYATMGFMGFLNMMTAKYGIENAGSQYGNDATLTNSMNRTTANPKSFGAGSATSTSSGTIPQQVVEPTVVQIPYLPPSTTP